jgi:cation/acetate symporter
VIGMTIVFFYAVLGGMKGITWTQVAQYSVLIVAYLIPAFAISAQLTGIPLPQVAFGQILAELDSLQQDLGFAAYTEAFTTTTMTNMILITAALMFGTAGLPHVIVRFYTAKSVRAARYSALWALFFISLLYTAAPAIGAFSKLNILEQIPGTAIGETPGWFNTWSNVGLITVDDLNSDGIIDYSPLASGTNATSSSTTTSSCWPRPRSVASRPPSSAWWRRVRWPRLCRPRPGCCWSSPARSPTTSTSRRSTRRPPRPGSSWSGASPWAARSGRRLPRHQPPGFVAQVVALAFGLAAASFFPVWCSASSGRTARRWAPRPA